MYKYIGICDFCDNSFNLFRDYSTFQHLLEKRNYFNTIQEIFKKNYKKKIIKFMN